MTFCVMSVRRFLNIHLKDRSLDFLLRSCSAHITFVVHKRHCCRQRSKPTLHKYLQACVGERGVWQCKKTGNFVPETFRL